jgi:hypothetical protein
MVKQISVNEIYLLIKYIKSVLWRVAKRLFYIQDAQCLQVNFNCALFSLLFTHDDLVMQALVWLHMVWF